MNTTCKYIFKKNEKYKLTWLFGQKLHFEFQGISTGK